MIPGVSHQEKKQKKQKKTLFRNSHLLLGHVKDLGGGLNMNDHGLRSALPHGLAAYPMKPTPIGFALHKIFHLEQ
jgi:hypothetical protein